MAYSEMIEDMPTPKMAESKEQLSSLENLRRFLLAASLPSRSSIEDLSGAFLVRLRDVLDYEIGSVYLKTPSGSLDRITSVISAQNPGRRTASYIDGTEALDALLQGKTELANKQDNLALGRVLNEYEDLLGRTLTMERVPLNGSSQVFGMVELACRQRVPASPQTQSDGYCLTIAASFLASAITTFRSRNETMVLADLSRFLSDPEMEGDAAVGEVFNKGLQLIVNGLMDYRAAVLRVATPEGSLEVLSKAGDASMRWDVWKNHIVRGQEALSGEVLSHKDRVISIQDISAQQERFVNLDWVLDNGLKSCISCPLVARGRTLGTVTFYSGFRYRFSELHESLVWCFAARFAAYWDRCQVLLDKEKTEADLEDIRYDHHIRLIESGRQAAVRASESQMTGILHECKGTYTSAILLLDEARDATPSERLKLLDNCLTILQLGEKRLDGPRLLDLGTDHALDVNEMIRSLVHQRNQWKKERRIGVGFELNLETLPLISISEEDLIELVENLLSNAIRAIRTAGRKRGEIRISTRVVRGAYTDELELVVNDNGTGIKRDILPKLFQKGFTTHGQSGGTGLGLYLVGSIVQLYKGTIRCESVFGSWTKFIILLPIGKSRV